jgi:hypothetical protein
MSNNPLYIKMVLALPLDFFKDWEWQEGDHLLHKELGSDQWYERTIGELEVSRNTILYRVIDYHDTLEGDIRPLPSQRQLQDMAKKVLTEKHNVEFDDWRLLVDFYNVTRDSFFRVFSPINYTLDVMWLQYVVHRMYNKRWDGEQWA